MVVIILDASTNSSDDEWCMLAPVSLLNYIQIASRFHFALHREHLVVVAVHANNNNNTLRTKSKHFLKAT